MSELSKIMDNHRIMLVPGTPDYRMIRKIEQEIHGEPLTPYPGEWDDVSRKRHRDHYAYGHPIARCLWCRDDQLDYQVTEANIDAKAAADRLAQWQRIPVPVVAWIAFSVALITVAVAFAVWG